MEAGINMEAGGESSSAYSSRFTAEATVSESATSEVEGCDVLLFYHHNSNMKNPVLAAKEILQTKNIKVRTSYEVAFVSGVMMQDLYVANARASRFKVFVLNTSFAKHDLQNYECILKNGEICLVQNTLFICREVHKKKIPKDLEHIQTKALSNRPNGQEIADIIVQFLNDNKSEQLTKLETVHLSKEIDKKHEEIMESNKKMFLNYMDQFDCRRSFILCVFVKPVASNPIVYEPLTFIPWPKVFDFDTETADSGLFNCIKNMLPKGRFSFCTQNEKPDELRQKVINWTAFVRSENATEPSGLSGHVHSLSKFCSGKKPATMLILWYRSESESELEDDEDELDDDLREFVTRVKVSFEQRGIKIVLCLPSVPENRTELSKISKRHCEFRTIAPLETICEWIRGVRSSLPNSLQEEKQTRIPKLKEDDSDEDTFELEQEELNWLTVDIHLLAFRQSPQISEEQKEKILQEGVEFLKGGELTWDVLENEAYDIRRDISKEIEKLVLNHISKGMSSIVTLYHAPGSGGTTVGRRVLWNLRKEAPCLFLEQRSEIREDFKEKIKLIRDKSNSPIVLLVDGRSNQEARNILDMCRHERVIILHVLRNYALDGKKTLNMGTFFLPDQVSLTEAPLFQNKLIKHRIAGIKKALAKLTEEIKNGKRHSVFEYGLTAFSRDFRGIGKYVESHLFLKNKTENWHKVAALLSLANYYGNCSLPAEFFSKVLQKGRYDTVDIETDIPDLGQQLIREYNGGVDWNISHYLVAKEILEQYLSGSISEFHTEKLSETARKKLVNLARDFLNCMNDHKGNNDDLQDEMLAILNSIFIVRLDKEDYDDDECKRKSSYSRLITDINNEDHQASIFKMMVEYFPTNPEFHAHYGRFLAKHYRHDEAEKSLEKAVEIRTEMLSRVGSLDPTFRGDDVLHRIHSMFGFARNTHVRHIFRNKTLGSMVDKVYSRLPLQKIREALTIANNAIAEFQKCRSYYCPSVSLSYGYIGEIQIRLHITEYCKKQTNHDLMAISQENHPLHFLWNFIEESFVECDSLLDQCAGISGEGRWVHREIETFVNLFAKYYGASRTLAKLVNWSMSRDSFTKKRCAITLMKIKWKKDIREFKVLEDLPRSSMNEYAHLLEDAMNDKESRKIRLSPYMNDWIKTIRHLVNQIPLGDIKSRVEEWDRRNEKESLSSFYKYVIQFLITLRYHTPTNLKELENCKSRLSDRLRSLRQNIVEVPMEWIKILTTENMNNLSVLHHKTEKDEPIQIFYGRIIEAKVWRGTIEIDGTRLHIFFVPKKFNVRSYHAKEKRRVQFHIAFNAKRGAQAYNVKFVSICDNCSHEYDSTEAHVCLP